jgi:hypothetical protein
MITRVQYLRLSTALPNILPVPLFIVFVIWEMLELKFPERVALVVNISFWAVFMFSLAYCILAGTVLLLLWKCSWKAHVFAALVAPILMIPVVGLPQWRTAGLMLLHRLWSLPPTVSDWDTLTLQQLWLECGCSLA